MDHLIQPVDDPFTIINRRGYLNPAVRRDTAIQHDLHSTAEHDSDDTAKCKNGSADLYAIEKHVEEVQNHEQRAETIVK